MRLGGARVLFASRKTKLLIGAWRARGVAAARTHSARCRTRPPRRAPPGRPSSARRPRAQTRSARPRGPRPRPPRSRARPTPRSRPGPADLRRGAVMPRARAQARARAARRAGVTARLSGLCGPSQAPGPACSICAGCPRGRAQLSAEGGAGHVFNCTVQRTRPACSASNMCCTGNITSAAVAGVRADAGAAPAAPRNSGRSGAQAAARPTAQRRRGQPGARGGGARAPPSCSPCSGRPTASPSRCRPVSE